MKIAIVGGGAAGLYFAISMKLRCADHEIVVFERNRPDDTFGWGVVFSDQTLANVRENDPVSGERIANGFIHWDDIDVRFRGQVITSGGHGFCGIGRRHLLDILQQRARGLGVDVKFRHEAAADLATYGGYDLVIAADGVNSPLRERYRAHFEVDVDMRSNKFVWLGTRRIFPAFNFIFEATEHGWMWVHAYRFDADTSTFIVECSPQTWQAHGFPDMGQEESCVCLERLFARHLGGERLMSNARHLRGSAWLSFPRVLCGRWNHGNLVLMGDAAHTAHFSIGSGTKLAFEDAIHLARALHAGKGIDEALREYGEVRRLEVLKLQNAARNSTEWFENVPRYARLEPMQFAYSLLTRSQRVSHENLRLRDRPWVERLETWFADRATGGRIRDRRAPMFVPLRLRGLELQNRIVVSPMDMYSAVDGTPGDFHLVHLGARAQGGAGLLCTEMTCVSAEGRITTGCAGMYAEAHVHAWKRIVDFVHAHSGAGICLQIGHAGPKGSTKLPWEGGDQPLDAGNWPLIGPSAIAYSPAHCMPQEMSRADLQEVLAQFVRAARMGARAGFDMLELHCAHGYLLSSFITPLANRRSDQYGGTLANRLRFPLEVFAAVREAWPEEKPISVRLSASDWVDGGITPANAVEVARAFAASGADVIDVSAGQTSPRARPVYGRMFQTPFSDRIRNEAGVATMAVGNIYEADQVNSIIAAGRADLCCLARPHLADPYWTLHAAGAASFDAQAWPVQYHAGRDQYLRNLHRAAQATMVQV